MTENEMYEAVIRNDARYDGVFFYGVKSTGIFCRPSCQSRKPLRENVRFFARAQEAIQAGFRPCKRCRSDLLCYHPVEEDALMIRQHIDKLESLETWREEIRMLGFSKRMATEIFQQVYGMTPKTYIDSLKLKKAKRLLTQTDEKVIEIAAAVGFGSLSTFYRFFKEKEGCSPLTYRKKQNKSEID